MAQSEMAQAIVLREHGEPEVMRLEAVPLGEPGPGEVLVRQRAIGVNFHDIYVRSGAYKTLALPGVPGLEAVGIVERVGPGVGHLRAGQRIGYVDKGYGAYADARILRADLAVALPDALDDVAAGSVLLKGLTACMLVRRVHVVRPGETVLVHAAAGGVGQLLCGWARHLGARVIGTAGSPEKAAIAKSAGADHVILYRDEDFAERIADLTGGAGVAVAYDAIGKDTFAGSLRCLGLRGTLVNYGQASGPVEPFAISALAARSNAVVRPMLFHYMTDREELTALAGELFAAIEAGVVRPEPGLRLSLAEAPAAHAALAARQTTGGIVLLPDAASGA